MRERDTHTVGESEEREKKRWKEEIDTESDRKEGRQTETDTERE